MNSCTIVCDEHANGSPIGQGVHHLPVRAIKVGALVVDVSAEVTITHTFIQPGASSDLGSARYVCPLPAGAAVCGFEITRSDGAAAMGVVKERQQAAKEHEAAMNHRLFTGLVDHTVDDEFVIKLGVLPACAWVKTKLTFVMDLLDNDHPDEIRLQLPVTIGSPHYGRPSERSLDAQGVKHDTRVSIDIRIQTGGEILDVTSPTHAITVAPFTAHEGEETRFSTAASFSSQRFLTSNFVVVIRARGLDEPRCFVETDPREGGLIALQMTLVPSVEMPLMPTQEYLILVDRSASMKGDRIETAKQTLAVLLRSLPVTGTSFNVIGFGSSCDPLWILSRVYDDTSLKAATLKLDLMQADLGGTDILLALRHAFSSRRTGVPTAVIVLTDGEDHRVAETISFVSNAVSKASEDSPLRVFVLGIGNTVSSAMVSGLARAGNGAHLMAASSEDIVKKCALLLRAAKSSSLSDVSVTWGADMTWPSKPMQAKSKSLDNDPLLDYRRDFRQSPSRITSMYPGLRVVVFVLMRRQDLPKEIIVNACLLGTQEVQFSVPMCAVNLPSAGGSVRLIHTLAARRMIMELLDREGQTQTLPEQHAIQKEVIRLGTRYQVVSKYTSVVAVKPKSTPRAVATAAYVRTSRMATRAFHYILCRTVLHESNSIAVEAKAAVLENQSDGGHGLPPPPYERPILPSYFDPTISGPSLRPTVPHKILSRPNYLVDPPPARATPIVHRLETQKFMASYEPDDDGYGQEEYAVFRKPPPRRPANDISQSVIDLVKLQAFDGSFTPSEALANIVGEKALKKPLLANASDQVWATAAAVAYLEKHMALHPELLREIREKVLAWVAATTKTQKFEGFVEQVRGLVQ